MTSGTVEPPYLDQFLATAEAAALRARSLATLESPADVHEPQVVSETYLLVAALFQL